MAEDLVGGEDVQDVLVGHHEVLGALGQLQDGDLLVLPEPEGHRGRRPRFRDDVEVDVALDLELVVLLLGLELGLVGGVLGVDGVHVLVLVVKVRAVVVVTLFVVHCGGVVPSPSAPG